MQRRAEGGEGGVSPPKNFKDQEIFIQNIFKWFEILQNSLKVVWKRV